MLTPYKAKFNNLDYGRKCEAEKSQVVVAEAGREINFETVYREEEAAYREYKDHMNQESKHDLMYRENDWEDILANLEEEEGWEDIYANSVPSVQKNSEPGRILGRYLRT